MRIVRSLTARAARAFLGLAVLAGVLSPTVAEAAQGNQGLQGGWAISDSGQVGFAHGLSDELPVIQSAGAGWVRINFRLGQCYANWTSVGCDGRTALQAYDEVVGNVRQSNLTILGLLSNEAWHGNQPDWTAGNAENAGGTGDNAYIQTFATNAAGVLAQHYAGTITSWEVWNEPNAWTANPSPGVYTGSSYIYPSNFAWLLQRSYQAIKQYQPGTSSTVITGGLFGHDLGTLAAISTVQGTSGQGVKRGDPGTAGPSTQSAPSAAATPRCGAAIATSGADYLCSTYQLGTSKVGWKSGAYPFEQIGQHLYVDQGGATSTQRITNFLQDVRNAYVAYEGSGTAKKTQVTEVGWSTASVTADVQQKNLRSAFRVFRTTTYVGRAYWFNVQDIPEAGQYYGLVDGTVPAVQAVRKPSYTAYQATAVY